MSKFVITLLLAIGVAGWAYAKLQRSTGGNTQTSVGMAAVAGAVVFILMYIVVGFLPE